MRGKAKEIEQVFQTHGFSINTIIRDIMGTFNFFSLYHIAGFSRQHGYSVKDFIMLMLIFPLMLINSVNTFYKIELKK